MSTIKTCKKDEILNPITNRCVKKNGKIGQKILSNMQCIPMGIKQNTGTCWFNSALNGLLLSEHGSLVLKQVLMSELRLLSPEDAQYVYNSLSDDDTCPLHLNRLYIFRYFVRLFCLQPMSYDKNHAIDIMRKMNINEKPLWVVEGGYPQSAIQQILSFLFKRQLRMLHYAPLKTINNNINTRGSVVDTTFIVFKNSTLENPLYKGGFSLDIVHKTILVNNVEFVLDHASIIVGLKTFGQHSIAGYSCNGKYMIYDANIYWKIDQDWTIGNVNVKNDKSFIDYVTNVYNTSIQSVEYGYICYVRKDRIPKKMITDFTCNHKNVTKTPVSVNNTRMTLFFFVGLGCSETEDEYLDSMKDFFAYESGIKNVILKCNKSFSSTFYDILKSACGITLKTDPFVLQSIKEMTAELEKGGKVHVYGHSYGGSVVSRIAEYFNDIVKYNTKLTFKTFGSIYIPEAKDVNKVDMHHYVFKDDICLRCLNKDRINKSNNMITWLDNKSPYKPTFGDKFRIFGAEKRWKIHNQYYEYMQHKMRDWLVQ